MEDTTAEKFVFVCVCGAPSAELGQYVRLPEGTLWVCGDCAPDDARYIIDRPLVEGYIVKEVDF